MFKILRALELILQILNVLKDTDGDGRPDVFDSEPNNPEVQ